MNPWGKPRRTNKNKITCSDFLKRYLLAIHVGEHQGSSGESPFYNKRPFVVQGPLPSVVFQSLGDFLQHQVLFPSLNRHRLRRECHRLRPPLSLSRSTLSLTYSLCASSATFFPFLLLLLDLAALVSSAFLFLDLLFSAAFQFPQPRFRFHHFSFFPSKMDHS